MLRIKCCLSFVIHFLASVCQSVSPSNCFYFFTQFVFLLAYLSFSHSSCLSVRLSNCLHVCLHLSVCLCVYLSVCASVCLSVHLSVCLSVRLSVCLSVRLSVCLSVRLSVCLCVYSTSRNLHKLICVPYLTDLIERDRFLGCVCGCVAYIR